MVDAEDLTTLRDFSKTYNLLNEFPQHQNISKYLVVIKYGEDVTNYVEIIEMSCMPNNIMQNQRMAIMDLFDYLLPILESPMLYLPGLRAVGHCNYQYFARYLPIERCEKDWILRTKHLFRANDTRLDAYGIVKICNDQTQNEIPLGNLIIGYIPRNILNELRRIKYELWKVMISNGLKFEEFRKIDGEVRNSMGVSIPGYCKDNHVSVLKSYFGSAVNDWIEMITSDWQFG